MVRKAADQWVDGFRPFFAQDTPPGLLAFSEHVQGTQLDLLGACMQAAVEHRPPFHGPQGTARRGG